jgi:hypothetical protein
MRNLARSLVLWSMLIGPTSALSDTAQQATPVASPPSVSGVPSWYGEIQPQVGSEFGFAPLSVTHSGVVYSPAAPAFDAATAEQPKIADLPAWASSYFVADGRTHGKNGFGALEFGSLPEPAAWVLILIGTAMICGALRGLIMANRRLARLRDDDEAPD